MSDQDEQKKRRLFDDISAAQVIATALAAVTSMLLASYIGIAGSVIGVAVASIVSTLAASAYKKFLRDSADKLKELPLPSISEGKTVSLGEAIKPKLGEVKEDASIDEASQASLTVQEKDDESFEATRQGAHQHESVAPQKRPQPTQQKMMRKLIVVCVVSALLAVAASGAVVYLLTTGNGLGAKPQIVYVNTPSDTKESNASSTNGSNANGGSTTQPSDQTAQGDAASGEGQTPDANGSDTASGAEEGAGGAEGSSGDDTGSSADPSGSAGSDTSTGSNSGSSGDANDHSTKNP